LKKELGIIISLLLAILFVPTACGKKGPPFLHEKALLLRVTGLSVEWKYKGFRLKGELVGPKHEIENPSNIKGCRVFYASYPLDAPPCEGCPIEYRLLEEIEGQVISEGRFLCEILVEKKDGFHFFAVRLIGRKGEIGPYSNRAKFVIDR
jgi:hypothetical protein